MSMKKVLFRISSVVFTSLGLFVVAVMVGVVTLPWPFPVSDQAGEPAPVATQRPSARPSDSRAHFAMPKSVRRIEAPPAKRMRRRSDRHDITVNVRPDGTIWVFGKPMAITDFEGLLGDFVADHLATAVTIAPDRDCLFRYVEPLIAICEDLGVPRTIVSERQMAAG